MYGTQTYMYVKARGTHPAINGALTQSVAHCSAHPYGLAVWVIDQKQGYAAPISSLNIKSHRDVDRFHEKFLRTKIPLKGTAVGDFVEAGQAVSLSKSFDGHITTHIPIDQSGLVIQIVGDEGQTVMMESLPSALSYVAYNASSYITKQSLDIETVFGLRDQERERYIIAMDINGFSHHSVADQSRLEIIMNDVAADIAEKYKIQIIQILGDQARFLYDDPKLTDILYSEFQRELSMRFGHDVSIGSVAAFGKIAVSFNGRYDDLSADRHYRGAVLTELGTALKNRPRHRTSLTRLWI